MQYEKPNERAVATPIPPVVGIDYRQDSAIQKTRSRLLKLLRVQWILCLITLIRCCINLARYDPEHIHSDAEQSQLLIVELIAAVFWLIYFLIFMVVVIKYIRLAILIFAGLSVIQLILTLVGIIVIIITALQNVGVGIVASVIIIIIAAIVCILSILVVVYAFRLAKLLRLQTSPQRV